jgi:hypothetical protein
VILILLSAYEYLSGRVPSSYKDTTGMIVSDTQKNVYSSGIAGHEIPTTYPIIAYQVNGVVYHLIGSGSTQEPPSFTVGQKEKISYNPSNPSSAKLTANKGPVVFGIVGTILGFALCFSALYFRRTSSSKM